MARHLESAEADLENAVSREKDIKQSLSLSLQTWKDKAFALQQQLDSVSSRRAKDYPVDIAVTISLLTKDTCDGLLLKLLFSAWRFIVTCSNHDKERQLQVERLDGQEKLQTPVVSNNLESAVDPCKDDARHDKGSAASTTFVSPSVLRSLFYTLGVPASELRDRLKDAAATIEDAQARAKSLESELEKVKADHCTQMEEAEQREHGLRKELDELKHLYESQEKAARSARGCVTDTLSAPTLIQSDRLPLRETTPAGSKSTLVVSGEVSAPQAREEHSQIYCKDLVAETRNTHEVDLLRHAVNKQAAPDGCHLQKEKRLETMQHRINLLSGAQDPAEACRLQNHRRLEMMQRRIDVLQQSTQQLRRASETAEEKQYVCWGSQMLEHHKDQQLSVVCAS